MCTSRKAPLQIREQLSAWWRAVWFWNITHYGLGLAASICSAVIAKRSATQFENMPVFVAVATAALTFLKSGIKANAYISAWRTLNAERIAFELDPNYTEVKLAEEHKKCEAIIGKAD
jgi:hypothetical protein